MKNQKVEISIRSEDFIRASREATRIAIRFRNEDLADLKKHAARLGVGHTSLARKIIQKWLIANGS